VKGDGSNVTLVEVLVDFEGIAFGVEGRAECLVKRR
jgi:hypothetical protein